MLAPRVSVFESSTLMAFNEWSSQFFPEQGPGTGIEDDFNGDGMSNLFSYAFGLDPRSSAGSENLPALAREGDDLLISMTVMDVDGVEVSFESSGDLASWTTLVPDEDYTVETSVDNGDGTRSMTLRIAGAGGGERFFLRTCVGLN